MSDSIPAAPAPVDPAPVAPAAGNTLLTGTPPADPAAPAPTDPAAPAPVDPPKDPEPPKAVVPEKYEFVAPEGVTLDPEQIKAFDPVARELGLTQEQAQKLVDLQVAHATAQQTKVMADWEAQRNDWLAQTKSDKDFGGQKFDENVGLASKALDKFGSPELRKALDDSGMGNHPAFAKFFLNVGRSISEDGMASGSSGGGGAPKTAAEILFPNMLPK